MDKNDTFQRISFGDVSCNEIRFFGRRKGKAIKGSKQKLLDELLPKLTVRLPKKGDMLDLNTLFGIKPEKVYLEVGFGGGEHLAALSEKYAGIGFIGAEPFMNGVASLLAHLNGSHEHETVNSALAPGRVDNVRIWPDDVREIFPYLKDKCFDRTYVLYPDPWPKARHEARRFINLANLRHLHRLLKTGGQIYVATDVAAYAEWAAGEVAASGLFEQVNKDVRTPPKDWVSTRYEKKGIKA
ncbi:MAG: tRNA (guanine(46)-N(7))-methyltransferase TrmB, partial [Lactobacillales bacterium]|nr:tRNA (guanine(46)-N(7))-methyltransferase TrmB [Lactobacillales bacterium]